MIVEITDTVATFAIAGLTGAASALTSWAAMRVTLSYMKRDIARAQATADAAHSRIDSVLGFRGGNRAYDPAMLPEAPTL